MSKAKKEPAVTLPPGYSYERKADGTYTLTCPDKRTHRGYKTLEHMMQRVAGLEHYKSIAKGG